MNRFCDWPEERWTSPDIDPARAAILSAGVDVGSVSSQAVVLADGLLYCYGSTRSGSDSPQSALKAMDLALQGTGLTIAGLHCAVGTGYGRVNVPFAKRAITETACHARGANFIYGPALRTVLDMGGQDCKAIRCDEKGKLANFIMNDKCAAGTGRGLEVMAELLQVPITQLGQLSLRADPQPEPLAANCVIFAKSEALALLGRGWPTEKVLAAYLAATAQKVAALIQRLGLEPEWGITGGIAKNPGVVSRLELLLGVPALKPSLDPQIAGALGAALFAQALAERERKNK